MKTRIMIALMAIAAFTGCKTEKKASDNPFLTEYNTPFGVPPFDKIKAEHYIPAFDEGMKQQNEAIQAIVNNTEAPTFANTIEALENSGELLARVGAVFFNLTEAVSSDSLQQISEIISPKLTQHSDEIMMNAKLFERVKAVYAQKEASGLSGEQKMLLEETYKSFVRSGANLNEEQKTKLKELNSKLSSLTLKYGQNLLADNNGYKLVIENEADLAGLPDGVKAAAAEEAKNQNEAGKWVFTLDRSSIFTFLTYSEKRELRQKIYEEYATRCNHNNATDNKNLIDSIINLRLAKAQILGYPTFAAYVLEENMSKNPENVFNLLNKLWTPAIAKAKNELADMQKLADKEGANFKLESWDWCYYAEKVRKEKYDLDEEMLRPYFKLENVVEGIFSTANKLYGLTFKQRNDLPLYHPDATTYEVFDTDGSHLGILYMDYHPRASKRGGAWCTSFRDAKKVEGKRVAPVVSIVCNFTKPTGDTPALLNYDEVETLFHEFGHGLHALLNQCTYTTTSNVPRDFVELPSQIMENWASEPEVMAVYARHYKTNEVIPQALVDKIKNSGTFNQGFATTEYLAASLLDMNYHTFAQPGKIDAVAFEKAAMDKIGLIPQILPRYRSTYFSHIFDGGYSAGYYGYIWAEVLDADAFKAFKETGNIFDQTKAKAFRTEVLEKGGSEDVMEMYKKFRGQEPAIDALLVKRGLI